MARDGYVLDPWRHVVLVATFFYFFIEAGSLKSLGILMPSLVFQLDTTYATMGVVTALPWSVEYLGSLLTKLAVKRIDARRIAAMGGLIASVAMITAGFMRNVNVVGALFFSVGVGQSMVIIPAIICLHQHFGPQFPFACAAVFIGSLVGIMILPVAVESLKEHYGPMSTLCILGAIYLNYLPIGLAYKPPRTNRRTIVLQKSTKRKSPTITYASRSVISEEAAQFTSLDCQSPNQSSAYSSLQSEDSFEKSCQERDRDARLRQISVTADADAACTGAKLRADKECVGNKHDISHKQRDDQNDVEDSFRLNYDADDKQDKEHVMTTLKKFLRDSKLFLVLALPADFMSTFVFISWMIFIVPYAVSIDIDEAQAVFIATVGSFGGLIVRIITTIILRLRPAWGPRYFVLLALMTSTFLFLQVLSESYTYLMVCSFIVGSGLYGSSSIVEAIISVVVTPEAFPTAVSISYFFKGISGIVTSYISGFMYDTTGSFKIVFRILAGVEVMSAAIMLILVSAISPPSLYFRRLRSHYKVKQQQKASSSC